MTSAKARAFKVKVKAKATNSKLTPRPKPGNPKARNLALRPRIYFHGYDVTYLPCRWVTDLLCDNLAPH